jgi:phage terminase large subunit
MKARKKVIQGGSSAGKTFGILPILINKALTTNDLEISVVSESIPHLKRGALKDFIKIMKATQRWREDSYNATDRKYTFHNGSYIEFYSPESVIGSRRHILYINEANHITYEDYYQLSIRTSSDIYIDFNPVDEFWAHNEVLKESDSELLILTYLDNEGLPQNVIADFEQAKKKAIIEQSNGTNGYWTNFVKVYVNGEVGSLQGCVFNNWGKIKDIPPEAQLLSYGLDWGFSVDPSGLIEVYKWNGKLIVNELLYEKGLTNSQLAKAMDGLNINKCIDIIADSAEPKSIQDLKNFGYYNTIPAKKGEDSIRQSINKIQEYELLITENSTNLIKELRSYTWINNNSGEQQRKPVDRNNHLIDPLRYVALNKLGYQGYSSIM